MNTLICQSVGTNDLPRDLLRGPVKEGGLQKPTRPTVEKI